MASDKDFGDVGEARSNFNRMSQGMVRLKEIMDKVEDDDLNHLETWVKELATVVHAMFMSTGAMFVQEGLRTTMTISNSGAGGHGGGASHHHPKGIMEHRVINNLKAVNGDKGLFRQWHQKFTTALGQYNARYEEMVHYMVREIDLGRDLGAVIKKLGEVYGEMYTNASGDVWKVLIDKAEAEAYDKIKTIQQGEGLKAYAVIYRWFTDVSGLGLAEQARRLMHPEPPKKEDDLAEHVEMWLDKMRRLEAHGDEYKLAPVFKINALRMLTTGKAREYFDLWEGDRGQDAAVAYEELLNKIKDYSMDHTVKKNMQ